jgi:hypothetical protein
VASSVTENEVQLNAVDDNKSGHWQRLSMFSAPFQDESKMIIANPSSPSDNSLVGHETWGHDAGVKFPLDYSVGLAAGQLVCGLVIPVEIAVGHESTNDRIDEMNHPSATCCPE